MAKHGNDKRANRIAAELIKKGDVAGARRVIAATSKSNQQDIVDRVIRGIQIAQGNN